MFLLQFVVMKLIINITRIIISEKKNYKKIFTKFTKFTKYVLALSYSD